MDSELDKKIRELTYNERTILASKGETISSFIPAEEKFEGNKYIVVKRTKRRIEDAIGFDLGVAESVIAKAFPGSLIKVNSNLVDNNPDILVTDRKPMQFRIGLDGMREDAEFTVSEPNYRTVSTGIDKTLAKYKGQELSARITFKGSMAYSESQLEVDFGLEMKDVKKSLNIDFNSVFSNKKTVYIMSFRQVFYTVTADFPKDPSDVFADSVTWESLKTRGVNNDNPPGLVYQVGYGRAIYVKIESSEQNMNVEAALKSSINENLNVTTNTKYKEILKNCSFSAVVLGGGTGKHISVITCKDIEEVKKIIVDNAKYSKDNPGYPLFYNVAFLKDNKNAVTLNSTEYIETTSEIHESGTIVLEHKGWYVAQYEIKWSQVNYLKNGGKFFTFHTWNPGDLTAPATREKTLNGNCTNISVRAWGHTGFKWIDTFEKNNVPLIPKRTFCISGTTSNQKYSVEPGL